MLMVLTAACTNDEKRLENKWQLQQYQYSDGTTIRVDSVFYNFQKGSFSAICLLPDDTYRTFFGNYSFKGTTLSIVLLVDAVADPYYERYIGWEQGKRTFTIEELSESTLLLTYTDIHYSFRSY
ncbi:MAG: lipocalin-like domain-containing protein [Prevotellaceae bacterium]|jgi:hypothetical protein|nr:lipocalin-like domain-containing protein [Prevotellaceae bacterium]